MYEIFVDVPSDFSAHEILAYLTRSPNECLHQVRGNIVQKLLAVGEQFVLLELTLEEGSPLCIRFAADETPSSDVVSFVVGYVREWLDLNTDLADFFKLADQDVILRPIVRQHRGLRIVGVPDLFEALCWAIIGQQINLAFAYELKRRFVESFGRSLQVNGEKFWVNPTPSNVCELQVDDLIQLKFTRNKATYVIDVAKQIASGELSKAALLNQLSADDVVKRLTSIRGIGPWTANYVAMRCLREKTAFPIQDVGLQNALKRQLDLPRKPTPDEILDMAKNWRGWEAYATFYLWRSLEATTDGE